MLRICHPVSVSLTPLTAKKLDFIVKYLREYKVMCKNALTRGSRAQMELFDEKPGVQKSLARVPSRQLFVRFVT
jgi:hypothetical protein